MEPRPPPLGRQVVYRLHLASLEAVELCLVWVFLLDHLLSFLGLQQAQGRRRVVVPSPDRRQLLLVRLVVQWSL